MKWEQGVRSKNGNRDCRFVLLLRLEYEVAVYHVASRSDKRFAILRDGRDRGKSRGILGSVCSGPTGGAVPKARGRRQDGCDESTSGGYNGYFRSDPL